MAKACPSIPCIIRSPHRHHLAAAITIAHFEISAMAHVKPYESMLISDTASSVTTLIDEEATLYRDRFVHLTTRELIIHSCYFPGLDYKISLEQIERADGASEIGVPCWQRKQLGVGFNPTIWWALDCRRHIPFVKHFHAVIIRLHGKCQRKGFSVEKPDQFMPLIRQAIGQADIARKKD
ncbi:hypothetical protein SYNPS1DRAFT_28995 [Syncephalis pseudoplumigaleata]|uniref:Uncharacterized protein n=1 Tax=Syncephalis pseudoplumigaleata TaxID=1712513 RepID=A0A4P9YZ50_9FUNG|nr:hypothetical protein SYNPS1DRAFT_28995 [Syncephalis pseudoplumigaleata]|eukprot:RKP25268.1 hypothetical protein SYNPS1DRAFT_28995 [Syncephalis pseudoplumigaleata]